MSGAGWSWNPAADLQDMWSYPFMVNAFRAGTIVAVTAALVGWFMVLRRQTFAGHTLSVAAFPGAAGATLAGIDPAVGYFGACLLAALFIARRGRRAGAGSGEESAAIGVAQAFLLACGLLFVARYHGFLNGLNALLFGTFLGITTDQVTALAVAAVVTLAALAAVGRRLLYASIDPAVAAARAVPVGLLGTGFLLLLGIAAAQASQITGAMLVFALLVLPAATAQRLTTRPAAGPVLAVTLALAATWTGLTVAYYTPYPVGFCIATVTFTAYLLTYLPRALPVVRRRPTVASAAVPGAVA